MPSLDIAMPIALLAVVTAALFLNERTEKKLKATVEEKEFKVRDVILLVVMIVVTVSVIAYTSLLSPGQVFQNVFLIIFLFSYSLLLFTFSYMLSNIKRRKAQLFSLGFAIASLIAGTASLLTSLSDSLTLYRVGAFFGLAIFSFCALLVDQKRVEVAKERWYVAIQPPALFVLLFVFFNVFYNGIPVWTPFLLDIFGLTFAILIILYLSSLFTWKTACIFAGLLTIVDIILVLGTGAMVAAAQQFTGLGLPVLVYLPNIPLIETTRGILFRGLGLGDFFFAGVLAVQTHKKFGRKTALISTVAMMISFGVFEAFLPEIIGLLEPLLGRSIGGFPGTLMIIIGWLPIVAWKILAERKKATTSELDKKLN